MIRRAIVLAAVAAGASTSAFAGINNVFLVPFTAPTLSEVGLGALIVIIAAVAGYAVRRKK